MRSNPRRKLSLVLPASVFLFFALLESVDTIGFEPSLAFETESVSQHTAAPSQPIVCRLKQGDDNV